MCNKYLSCSVIYICKTLILLTEETFELKNNDLKIFCDVDNNSPIDE